MAGDLRARELHRVRAERFLRGRKLASPEATVLAMSAARQEAARLEAEPEDFNASLNASWQAVGPKQVRSPLYGAVTGRVSAIAIDPADPTGNTIYVGTTGGGVWKSTDAAGPAEAVSFSPLTDTLPVFSPNSGTTAIPSLSIGAISVQNGVILAGTGDPNDATDSFYGTGLLRSADEGTTWTLIQGSHDGVSGNHSFVGLSFTGFAWSTTQPDTVVAAVSDSADGTITSAPDGTNSVKGLYVSNDAGETWQMATIRDGAQVVQQPLPSGGNLGGNAATSVVWDPVRSLFFAAVRYHGYYQSSDGISWTRLAQQPGGSLLSLSNCPTDPGSTGNPNCPLFRGTLAVQPGTGDLFALTTNSSNLDEGLWQDVCGSTGSGCASPSVSFAKQLPSAPLEVGNGSMAIAQADYNLSMAAVASGSDTLLFVGTTDLYRCSLAAGCVFRNTTNATNGCAAPAKVAPAQHAIAAMQNSGLVFLGNDGGLWRSTDGVNEQGGACSADDASHFQNLNGGLGSLAEVVSFAESPSDANVVLAGLGANGSAASSAALSQDEWPQLSGGEGGTVAIDPANPENWFVSTAAGISIRACANGAACTAADFLGPPTIGLTQVENDASAIDPPWLLDPGASAELIAGTCRVWRGPAADGGQWTASNAISPMLTGPQNSACGAGNGVIRSLAAGGPASGGAAAQNTGSKVLYAGMAGALDGGGVAGGHLFAIQSADTATSGSAWTDLANSPVNTIAGDQPFNPGQFDISSVAVDPHDATGLTVYATVMGFHQPHVYRSINGGASWTNVTSNLPDAPANSVLVDPNDANTLYVAMDTGVYVTDDVTTCSTVNCWSPLGLGLPNAPVIELAASSGLPTGDGRTGELRAATYGRGIWQIPLLSAAGPAAPAISLAPQSLSFESQAVDTVSTSQTVTLTNTGDASLTVSSIAVSGDFVESDTCTAATIAVNGTCQVQVRFLPTTTGTRTGQLTIYGNVSGGQATLALTGNATPGQPIVLTPVFLSFPSTAVGARASAENITIANTDSVTLGLGGVSIAGDFSITANTCGSSLAPNSSCTVGIVFSPTVRGSRTGTLTVKDDAGTQTAVLSGQAVSPATDTLAPLSLTFGRQQVNTVSAAQQVTLANTGDVALTLISAQTTGDFTVVNGCGSSLNAHATCSFAVAYVPKNVGAETGTLTVSDFTGQLQRTQTVALSGTGVAPPGVSLAPYRAVSFAPLGVGLTSAAQTVTLTNNGGAPLTISGFQVMGDFAIAPGSNTCTATLAIGAACTFQVVFQPTAAGLRTGVVTVSDDAPSGSQSLALTGTGVDFSLVAGNSAVTVASGDSAVYSVLLSSASGVPGSAAFTCTGVPAHATCLVLPAVVALGNGTTAVTVTVATGVATASANERPRGTGAAGEVLWAACVLPFAFVSAGGRRRLRSVACLVVLAGLVAVSGCGAGRLIPAATQPSGGTTPTPAGTSTITVSATSAGLVRTVSLSLTVQ